MQNTEQHNDCLEYVRNITKLGGNTDMAEYQARYIEKSTARTIDDAIAKLHLERFATKEDVMRLEIKVNNVEHNLEKFKISIESKLYKHTVLTISATVVTNVLTNLPRPVRDTLWSLLHIS